MRRNLIQTGNSKALILTKDMRDHLGIEDEVEVEFRRGSIVLRHPEAPDDEFEAPTKKPKAEKAEKTASIDEPKAKDKAKASKGKAEKSKGDKPKEKKNKKGK